MDIVWNLMNGKDCIEFNKYQELATLVKQYYHSSTPGFWMWKMFQFGFMYGKRQERARRRNTLLQKL